VYLCSIDCLIIDDDMPKPAELKLAESIVEENKEIIAATLERIFQGQKVNDDGD
jgi:hypothetical protein